MQNATVQQVTTQLIQSEPELLSLPPYPCKVTKWKRLHRFFCDDHLGIIKESIYEFISEEDEKMGLD